MSTVTIAAIAEALGISTRAANMRAASGADGARVFVKGRGGGYRLYDTADLPADIRGRRSGRALLVTRMSRRSVSSLPNRTSHDRRAGAGPPDPLRT